VMKGVVGGQRQSLASFLQITDKIEPVADLE
jgi:hypothetical protein